MIKFCFKEFELGFLSFDKKTNEFVYNSLLENERNADKKYQGLEFYYLKNSVNRRSKTLFKQFDEFAGCLNRPDIIRLAELEEKDSLFEKLEKLAKLNIVESDYFISYEN